MLGQAAHFSLFAPEKIPYAVTRYMNESKRLFSVVESRLAKSEYIAGTSYGIADIKIFPWYVTLPSTAEIIVMLTKLNSFLPYARRLNAGSRLGFDMKTEYPNISVRACSSTLSLLRLD